MSTELSRKRDELVGNFEKIDAEIDGMDEGPDRDRLESESSALKAEAAAALPEEERLQRYRQNSRAWNTDETTDRDVERSEIVQDEDLAARADAGDRGRVEVDRDADDEPFDGWAEQQEEAWLQRRRDFQDQQRYQPSDAEIERMETAHDEWARMHEWEEEEGRETAAETDAELDDRQRRDRRRDRDDGHSL